MEYPFNELIASIEGDFYNDQLHRMMYATDASVYSEWPIGVVLPKHAGDVVQIVNFCNQYGCNIIPRGAGTSLAGQCVGNGLVVDVSKYMNEIIAVDINRKEVTVQPGVVRDDLNRYLKQYGLFFGPNTSTANRATIGGMVGNNSCGSTSIVYGDTRSNLVSLEVVLSDGQIARFFDEKWQNIEKSKGSDILNSIYSQLWSLHRNKELLDVFRSEYPDFKVQRRNTGYALDQVLNIYDEEPQDEFNICKLLAGSEGTLAFTTSITLKLSDLPPPHEVLVAIHYNSINECLESVPKIMEHAPFACELMDDHILNCTKGQRKYEKDRFFIKANPKAILLVSAVGETESEVLEKIKSLISEIKARGYGYEYPIIQNDIDRIWNLRKAGLGLLANIPGDKKAVACIEDTAVRIDKLAEYIRAFTEMMDRYGQESVYYAHAGAGELHLRPILNLKDSNDQKSFVTISKETAQLVKQFKGSLSGEHGDGRVRAPFLNEVFSDQVIRQFKNIKNTWDPGGIFNPGKIVDPKPILSDLRHHSENPNAKYSTIFNFDEYGGILMHAEMCNGSGDCRKSSDAGGVMCPSYMATLDEQQTTRARANVIRESLSNPNTLNGFQNEALHEVLSSCLSCKGCTSECPSNVNVTKFKSEIWYQKGLVFGFPFRDVLFGRIELLYRWFHPLAPIVNYFQKTPLWSAIIKSIMGIHKDRTLPSIQRMNFRKKGGHWLKKQTPNDGKKLYLFVDEFTNYLDVQIGMDTLKLLYHFNYQVHIVPHFESGRAALSKGLLKHARKCANQNVRIFSELVDDHSCLIGIEPSAILSFRDEYPDLVDQNLRKKSIDLAKKVFTIEEFLYKEAENGMIDSKAFIDEKKQIHVHNHCHQKALSDTDQILYLLSLPNGHVVKEIPTGCCGMAGSFGYEENHFDLSKKIAELKLLPTIQSLLKEDYIVTSGHSCRHQIKDLSVRQGIHPVSLLYHCLKNKPL